MAGHSEDPIMNTARRALVRAAPLVCALPLPAAAGLFSANGKTKDAQRANVRKDRDQILARLYRAHPEAKAKIAKAVGYATFNNTNMNLFLLSTGHGYGMVVDKGAKKETFMAMASLGGGVGLGAKDLRMVFIFKSAGAMRQFVTDGWHFGAEADATAKAGSKGGAAAAEGAVDTAGNLFEIYQLTENGIALQATVAGTKYWKDSDLNS
jgi:lipid-binding SYLF domain-containing protein